MIKQIYAVTSHCSKKKKSAVADKTASMLEKSYQDAAHAISSIFKTMQWRKHIKEGFSTQDCLIHTVPTGSREFEKFERRGEFCLRDFFFFKPISIS